MLVLLLLLISRLINQWGLRISHSKVFSSVLGMFSFDVFCLCLDMIVFTPDFSRALGGYNCLL